MLNVEIITGTYGCPRCDRHAHAWVNTAGLNEAELAFIRDVVDQFPVRQYDGSWHDEVRGDGSSYSGVVEVLTRLGGELAVDFAQRLRAAVRRHSDNHY